MPLLVATGLVKAYGAHTVLGGVDFRVHTGERVGLVGTNGSGKSTLVRLLVGEEQPDAGTIARRRDATLGHLAQVPTFDGDPTAREAVVAGLAAWSAALERHEALGDALARGDGDHDRLLDEQASAAADVERLGGWDRDPEIDAMLGFLGLTRPDARVSTLSGGEQRRVAIARLFVARPDVLVLDEPTNHLDLDTIDWLEGYLAEVTSALVLVTHDRYLLDRVVARTVEVDHGRAYSYDGGYGEYLEEKATRLALAERTEQNRQNFLRTEIEWLRRQPKARSTKQKARIQRAESAKREAPPPEAGHVELRANVSGSGRTVLEVRDLGLELGGRVLVRDLTMTLLQGERLGVVGPSGAGKTTLLRALLGEIAPTRGQVVPGRGFKVAYFDQARSGLDEKKTVFENAIGDATRVQLGEAVLEPRSYLERFLFDGARQRQPVGSLSGGERARVALAKILREPASLLVLDEPTNDLDLSTLSALEAMLVEGGSTAIVVTHDRWFLDRVSTGVLVLPGDGSAIRDASGGEAYVRARDSLKRRLAEDAARARAPKLAERRPSRPAFGARERARLDDVIGELGDAEATVAALLDRLGDPAVYSDGDAVKRVHAELDAARAEVSELTTEWEALEALAALG
ncbi:MAG: ABC-F family ATP-binding cassette domain-containing protein [Polyangiaceae bacterium]|nr:ABC-F family ATP-binding cassette domain-containing protein [Polyangiaceae bacterium]